MRRNHQKAAFREIVASAEIPIPGAKTKVYLGIEPRLPERSASASKSGVLTVGRIDLLEKRKIMQLAVLWPEKTSKNHRREHVEVGIGDEDFRRWRWVPDSGAVCASDISQNVGVGGQ